MASGELLAKLLKNQYFIKNIKEKKYFVSATIYNNKGQHIDINNARGKGFCFCRVTLLGADDDKVEIIAALLRRISNIGSEHVYTSIHNFYGFHDIIVC